MKSKFKLKEWKETEETKNNINKKKMPIKEVWLEKKNSRDQLRICTWVGRNLADSKILG